MAALPLLHSVAIQLETNQGVRNEMWQLWVG
jgi:hypothetical protein